MMRPIARLLAVAVCVLSWTYSNAFEIRGMHIDMRSEVMTVDALKALAADAAAGGVNTIVMEWEATFPFADNSVICNDLAYSRKDVADFISYCSELGIQVIPLQNCFGHCEYILRHDRYAALREDGKDFSQVCPSKIKQAKEVFRSIFSEIAEMHPSPYIHIGADETRLLGHCVKCAAKVSKEGKSKLFCDYVSAMCDVVRSLGKTPVIWSDIITKYPEAAGNLPEDLIIVDWNYGWDVNRFGDFQTIVSSGLQMWGAPALRSSPDDLGITQWMKHFNNLRDYVTFAREQGFKGIVETSWSTSGQYGYIYSNGFGAIDIQPIRQVYPLSGFRILQKAFCEAASSEAQFEPEAFIRRYCADTFGFDAEAVQTMLDYFNMPQNRVNVNDMDGIANELETARAMRGRLRTLRPRKGKDEFAHHVLMLDIRINYLRYLGVKSRYESRSFDAWQKGTLASEMHDVLKECRALKRRYCKLNKGYLKDPERSFNEWTYYGDAENIYANLRNVSVSGKRPLSISGSDDLIVSAYDLALKTVRQNIKGDGLITAGFEYGGEWTRDISINTRNACNIVCPRESVHSLWSVTLDDGARVGHQYWDKIIWVPAAYEQCLAFGDTAIMRKTYLCSANTMAELEASVFDDSLHLFKGPSVFNDGIAGYEEPVYDPQNESGNVLDYPSTYQICCLSTNCTYLEAYKCLSRMAQAVGNAAASAEYEGKAEALRESIRAQFLDLENHKLAYLIDQNGDVHHFQEGLGYAFAVLYDVLNKDEAAALIANAHVSKYGVPSIWPDFKRFSQAQPGRHNNLVWPHVNTYFAEAALKAGCTDEFLFELRNLADLAMNKSGGCFYEIYNPETGMPDGGWQKGGNLNSSKGQTWCATGYLSLIYRGIFGMEFTSDGLTVAPDKSLMDAVGVNALHGLKYGDATVDIEAGRSLFKRGLYVNGKKAGGSAVIPKGEDGSYIVKIF